MDAAQASLKKFQAELTETHGITEQELAERNLMVAQEAQWQAELRRSKARMPGSGAEQSELDRLDAELATAKKRKEDADKELDLAIQNTAGMTESAAREARKAADAKIKREQEKIDEDKRSQAMKELFGGKFTFPLTGETELSEFGQGSKNFTVLLEDFYKTVNKVATAGADDVKAASEQNHAAGLALREALRTISGSVTDATLGEFNRQADGVRGGNGGSRHGGD